MPTTSPEARSRCGSQAATAAFVPDGQGGNFLRGTFELDDPGGDRDLSTLVGGHNHMVDKLHLLASGGADEYCFCFISRP